MRVHPRQMLLVPPDSGAHPTPRLLEESVRKLESSAYDGVLLRVTGRRDLSLLLRIKELAPRLPLIALVPELDRDLFFLARENGADEVLPSSPGEIPTDELIRRCRSALLTNADLAATLDDLLAQSRAIREHSFQLCRIPSEQFLPLIVEDDLNETFFLSRAFLRIGLRLRLPVMRDADEAQDYLTGSGAYRDRARYPLPTLVVTDLKLPGPSGLELASWIRTKPSLRRLVVFILTGSTATEDRHHAIISGADYLFRKPQDLADLEELTKVIAMRWSVLHRARAHRS